MTDDATRDDQSGASASARPAILLVDDDDRNLTAIAGALGNLDADLFCGRSGEEALRLVLRHDFCAILMDVRMPGMDGYETADIIRQRGRSRRIPIIFLTAYDKEEAHVFRGYSAGAVDFVFKPVEPVILRAKVSVFIELHKQADEIRRKAEQEQRLLKENLRVRAERMETEHQLRSSERREALIIRSLPIAVYESDLQGDLPCRTFLHEDSVKRLLGFSATEFEQNPELWRDRLHPEDRHALAEALKSTSSNSELSIEYRWRCADDTYRHFLDQWILASPEDGNDVRVVGTVLDVDDRRTLEKQLVHAQKIDAVGKLTGGIVHDFNNMLTVVIGNLDRMRRTEGLDPRTSRRVDHALQGALHCRDMTKRLLGFARQQSISPQAINLNTLIHDLAGLLTRTLGERIDICKDLGEELWQIYADPGQIEAAILNLLVNARDAMPSGGKVSIRTSNILLHGTQTEAISDLGDGEYVVMEVIDTGVGMDPDVLYRACEPFFTTKESGRGTGLGLSTISGFARQSGGAMALSSAPGEGTAVRIFLPRHHPLKAGDADLGDDGLGDALVVGTGELVLLVEDEEAVRNVSANTLREFGYRVLEAETAATALEALREAEDVSLLFTDLVMPGSANGYELAQMAREMRPDLRVLYTSAYGDSVISTLAEGAIEPLLHKPYRDHELARAIHLALKTPQGRGDSVQPPAPGAPDP